MEKGIGGAKPRCQQIPRTPESHSTYLILFYVHWCEGVTSFGTGATDNCELPCGCQESNLDPLELQPAFVTAEPSPEPGEFSILMRTG